MESNPICYAKLTIFIFYPYLAKLKLTLINHLQFWFFWKTVYTVN